MRGWQKRSQFRNAPNAPLFLLKCSLRRLKRTLPVAVGVEPTETTRAVPASVRRARGTVPPHVHTAAIAGPLLLVWNRGEVVLAKVRVRTCPARPRRSRRHGMRCAFGYPDLLGVCQKTRRSTGTQLHLGIRFEPERETKEIKCSTTAVLHTFSLRAKLYSGSNIYTRSCPATPS